MSKNLILRPITIEDCRNVADVHLLAFPDSALTRLGIEAVSRYYQWQLIGPHECVALGAYTETGQMKGFIFGGSFHGSLSGFINKNRWYLIGQVLTHPWLIANPIIYEKILVSMRILMPRKKKSYPKETWESPQKKFGILAIAVDPNEQRSGVGKVLMEQVVEEAKKLNFTEMVLTVHPTNFQAVRFYEKLSWKHIETDGVWSGKMVKDL
jgi:ribosomal protein S18 acetylase RimI-like enzyme